MLFVVALEGNCKYESDFQKVEREEDTLNLVRRRQKVASAISHVAVLRRRYKNLRDVLVLRVARRQMRGADYYARSQVWIY